MATYLIQIPANYRARFGGNSSVSVDASSPQEAKTQVAKGGVPAALIGTPAEITGNITSGSLPPNVSEYVREWDVGRGSRKERYLERKERNFGYPLMRHDRVIGANNPIRAGLRDPNTSGKTTQYIYGGREQVPSNPFAPNINPEPTMAEIQAAMPFQPGTPGSPFYQPPSYQQMTAEDFAQIRANANQPLFDEQSFLGGSFNTGGKLPEEIAGISSGPTTGVGPSYDPTGGSFATDADEIARMEAAARKQLADRRAAELASATSVTDSDALGSIASTERPEDIDAIEAEIFAREERERLAKIRREAAAAAAAADDNADDDKPDGSVDMPANLPQFWKERYNEYLGLPSGQQQAILDNQLQNYIDLNDWQISTGGATEEEGGGVSGAAGANLTLQELEELAQGGTTGGGAGGGFGFDPGAFTGIPQPMNFEGFPVTGLQDMLNIFYSKPDQFIVEQPVMGTIGYDEKTGLPIEGVVGSQQSLSPAAQAALQAFSTQRGAESADLASRFGTSTPFGAIAGLGGTSADAVGLAELQARAGVSNPYAALGTGSTIGDIGTILRGGLTTQEQSELAGLQARGGLSVEEQLALAGMQARGGLTPEEQLTLSGLQARGGLSAQERLAEQRLGILPSLFQATPQALGGLSRVLGGEEALRGALTPFFGGVPAQQQPFAPAPAMRQGQPATVNISSSPIAQQEVPRFRPTLGDYQGAGMFEQGGLQAEAGMAGQELPKFLGEVSPQGTSTSRGGLGATTTGRFTY